jgi:DNA-binding beta-propeller fold protein YncE
MRRRVPNSRECAITVHQGLDIWIKQDAQMKAMTGFFSIITFCAWGVVHATSSAGTTTQWNIGGAGGWDYLAIDETTHRLFVSRSDREMVLSTVDGRVLGTVPGLQGVHGVAFDHARGKGFASNGRGNSVTKFDLASLAVEQVFPIPGVGPDTILFDMASDEVWTFNGHSRDATVLNAESGKIVATVPLDGRPEFAVADGHGRIFVNDEDHGALQVIDAKNHRVATTWKLDACEGPTGIALDDLNHRLFSTCQNGRMAITDSATGRHVATVPIGQGPDAAAFDAGTHRAYSSNGRDGTLTVVRERDADHFDVETTIQTQKSARTMALDSADHRIYLAAATFEAASPIKQGEPAQRPPMVADSFRILVVTPPADDAPARPH